MAQPIPTHDTLDDWIAREALPFALDSPATFDAAVDRVIAALGGAVKLLGFGEALHGGEDLLILRNRLFQRLVEAHGYSAIAVESSITRSPAVDDYVAGRGPDSYGAVQDAGFSHDFGKLGANRDLVEWMRQANADPSREVKLRFYGFDTPTEMMFTDSPRRALYAALDVLALVDGERSRTLRERIDPLLGQDAAWETPEAAMDPSKSIGLSPEATALRIETEDLIADLNARRPDLVAKTGQDRYLEAVHYASVARQLLTYHAQAARDSSDRIVRMLSLRDAWMADNLAYIATRERGRGNVFVFAHNSHLKYGQAEWQLGPHALAWWPAGAHLRALFGAGYAVIGSALGVSDANGIGQPEPGTLEGRLIASPGPARFVPTHRGQGLPAPEIAALPARSGSAKNATYFPLTRHSLADFDWLAALDSTAYARGGPPLPP
jgi:erythromycin esterase-like protein